MKPMPPDPLPPNSTMQTNLLPTNSMMPLWMPMNLLPMPPNLLPMISPNLAPSSLPPLLMLHHPSATNKSDDADLNSHVSVNRRIQRICFRCFGRIPCRTRRSRRRTAMAWRARILPVSVLLLPPNAMLQRCRCYRIRCRRCQCR